MNRTLTAAALSLSATLFACGEGELPDAATSQASAMTYAEFRAQVHQEPGGRVFIVDGDTPIVGEAALRAFFDELQASAAATGVRRQGLAVNTVAGADDRWSDAQRQNLSYCVSTAFGARQAAVVSAMAAATAEWSTSTFGRVRFVYTSAQDGSCTAANNNVLFNVSPVSGQPYLARAFFPSSARVDRSVLIDSTSFGAIAPYTLPGILRHELGHTLGFRHEHTRPEAGTCFENSSWRALTSYDSSSVMHYPQCNGANRGDLVLTAKDKTGAATLYPAPYVASVAELSGRWFRITNAALGEGRSLDTYSNAPNQPFMGDTGSYSGQFWRITSLGGGFYRLNNSFLGDARSLDSSPTAPVTGPTGSYSGQYWKLTPDASRCFRLTNLFQGDGKSLDVGASAPNAPVLGASGPGAGQCWRLILQ